MRLTILFTLLFALVGEGNATAQELPAGYTLLSDVGADAITARYDYDGDGSQDAFYAAQKSGTEDAVLVAVLNGGKTVLTSASLSICCGSISQKDGVVDVHSRGMRGFTYYKFRWDSTARDFRLIGYDTESFGNAANDGSGKSSFNLLTGGYEAAFNKFDLRKNRLIALPKVKRRIPIARRIYLQRFGEQADEWLAGVNAKYLPEEVR